MSFRLLGNLVAIEEDQSHNKTASGIVIADAPDGLLYGRVRVVGSGNGDSAPTLQEGDLVFLPRQSVRAMPIQGKTYFVVDEVNVFGVIEGDDA